MKAAAKLPVACTIYPVTIGANRPNTLPPRTMNANARPLSACERSRSLQSAALVAVAVPPKLIGRMVKMTSAVSESTNGMAKPADDNRRHATTTMRRRPLRIVPGVRIRSPIQLVRTIRPAPTKNGTEVKRPEFTIDRPRAVCR